MKHIFVINPKAGDGKAEKEILPVILQAAEAAGISYEIHITADRGDAESFVRNRCQTGENLRFYSCGGDGTLNEVVNGAYGSEQAEIAVIPSGSGNDFVRTFGNYSYFSDIARNISGSPVQIDMMSCNGRVCANVCNIGFDSVVADKMEKLKKYPFLKGTSAYIAGIATEFFRKMGNRLTVRIDSGEVLEDQFLLLAAGSGAFYGGGFNALPRSSRTGGVLDLCMVRKISRIRMLGMIMDYKAGRHITQKKFRDCVIYRKCRQVEISAEKPFLFCADGEISEMNEVRLEALPGAMRLSLPEGCSIN